MGDTYTNGDNYSGADLSGSINNFRSHVNVYLPADPEDRKRTLDAATARLAQLPTAEDVPIPAPAPLPTPHRIPLLPSPTFVGRDAELRQIATALTTGTTAVVSAVTGIGGMGKTQLASEFAHRYGTFFLGGVFWLSLADAGSIEAEIAACGGTMQIPAWETIPFADQVQRVRQIWEEPLPRLLIFDNCEELALLDTYRPTTGGCRVLVTSRRDDWNAARHLPTLALATLPRAQSIALLRQFRPDLAEDDPTLDALAAELGDLPLALHVAGSFLQRYPRQSLADYLAQLRAAPLHALTQHLERLAVPPTRHDLDVARTFGVSYNQLDATDPIDHLARALLARAACFAPGEPIPTEVLTQTLSTDTSTLDAEDALRRLGELGLLEESDNAWRLHRLLATFVRVTVEEMDAAQEDVEETLIAVTEKGNAEGFPARLLPLQAHLRHVVAHRSTRADTQVARLLNAVGMYLNSIADYQAALPLYERALAISEATLGPDHPDTATNLNDLALLLKTQGHFDDALPLLQRALAIREAAFGPDHPDTAQSLNNLAGLLRSQGRFDDALPRYQRAFTIAEATLGPNHPKTATALGNLASLLQAQGRFDDALPRYQRAFAIHEAALGPDHPETATALGNLASLLQAQGRFDDALPLFQRALAIREATLGPDHPTTAPTLGNLASLLQAQGRFDDARPLFQRALSICEVTLGPGHPETATALNNLAHLLHTQGRFDDARPLYERALAICEAALGSNHPETATTLGNLASLLQGQGHFIDALPLHQRALAIREATLSPNHPHTAASLDNLARLLQAQGRLNDARPLYERALTIFEIALGPDHPTTATSLNNLAVLYANQQKFDNAIVFMQRALAIRIRVLGPDHPNTIASRKNLAAIHAAVRQNNKRQATQRTSHQRKPKRR